MTPQEHFVTAYIEALYFTDTGEDEQPPKEAELAEAARTAIEKDCARFLELAAERGLDALSKPEQGGHDFWLTRNRHGAGFWDRDDSVWEGEELRRKLTELSHLFGECWTCLGDDGFIHVDGDWEV